MISGQNACRKQTLIITSIDHMINFPFFFFLIQFAYSNHLKCNGLISMASLLYTDFFFINGVFGSACALMNPKVNNHVIFSGSEVCETRTGDL